MARIMAIMGESGSGKTTSLRTLNPKTTCIIDCDKKVLSWRGWKKQYNSERKNYVACDDVAMVQASMLKIAEKRPEVSVIVIDTIGSLMVADEMRRSKEKGYDKWLDLAVCIWNMIDAACPLRDDLTVVFMAHVQTERDDSGYVFSRIKTSGRKLDKIVLESKFPIVLYAKNIDGEFVFETHAKQSTAKSPLGLFDEETIPNDLKFVIEALDAYENSEEE
jgi:adenylate kinase family enzyme